MTEDTIEGKLQGDRLTVAHSERKDLVKSTSKEMTQWWYIGD